MALVTNSNRKCALWSLVLITFVVVVTNLFLLFYSILLNGCSYLYFLKNSTPHSALDLFEK